MDLETLSLAGLFFLVAALYSSVGHAGASGYLAAMAELQSGARARKSGKLAAE